MFYQKLHTAEYFNKNPTDSGLLEIEDIPTECFLFRRHFKISEDGCENCLVNYTDISHSLHKICQQTENCDGIIFMGDECGAYASSLMYRNEKVYTFDPHSLSPITGMPCANGTFVLLAFDSISKFAEYLVQCASTHRHAQQITFWKLNITKMQQDQCTDPNFKSEGHQDANSKLHTGKLESKVVHSKAKNDHMKKSTIKKCSKETDREYTKHSQTESEHKLTLICDICSKTLDNLYNFNIHKEKCKGKKTFICKICSKNLDNSHNLKLHEEKCKKTQKLVCKTCSKKLDNWYNLNLHETKCKKKHSESKIIYKCNICSKIIDNKTNLLQHQRACELKKKKKDHNKLTVITQLKSKYATIINEENIITEQLRQIQSKIKDRQCQILKLEEQVCSHKKKNNSDKNYLKTQISNLQDQIFKYKSLIEDLSSKKMELCSQGKVMKNKLQLFSNEISTDDSDIAVTRTLPNINTTTRVQQTEQQNRRKRHASDLIRQTSESSLSDTDANMDIPAKKAQYSNYQTDDFDSNAHEKHQKSQKREHMKQKRKSTEYKQKEHLKQRECDTQTAESSVSDTDSNMDVPAKITRHNNYQTDEFDSNAHEKHKKSQNRIYERIYETKMYVN